MKRAEGNVSGGPRNAAPAPKTRTFKLAETSKLERCTLDPIYNTIAEALGNSEDIVNAIEVQNVLDVIWSRSKTASHSSNVLYHPSLIGRLRECLNDKFYEYVVNACIKLGIQPDRFMPNVCIKENFRRDKFTGLSIYFVLNDLEHAKICIAFSATYNSNYKNV